MWPCCAYVIILHRPQRLQHCFLGCGHAGHTGDIHAFIRPVGPERFETLAGLDILELDRFIFTATGQGPAIGMKGN
jgi:hypothetical protein